MKERILVYDDDGSIADKVGTRLARIKSLSGRFKVESLPEADFKAAMDELANRYKSVREVKPRPKANCAFDKTAILIVDQDLLTSDAGEFITGEEVAYLVRCFSTCELIAILNQFNQFGERAFDLTLRGHPESFADLNVGEADIDNPGLWGDHHSGFRPWNWPVLPRFLDDFRMRLKDARVGLARGSSISEIVGIPAATFALMPRSVSQMLGKDPGKATFRDFASDSEYGLRRKDAKITDDNVISRVSAARISKWIERVLLRGQESLVDAPHLVSRFPSLLNIKSPKLSDWNKTAVLHNDDECAILSSLLRKHRAKRFHWFSRPVWFWAEIAEDSRIPEVEKPWGAKQAPYVFCEDDSRFHKESDCREFVADTDSPFSRRFVKGYDKVATYRPLVRFSM